MDASLIKHFNTLPDPRVDRTKRYPLIEIIFLIIAATVSGCEGWKQIKDFGDLKLDWLRQYLPYANGIPVDDTLARVMRKLNTKAFQERFIAWMSDVSTVTHGDVVAIDGKTLRRSYDSQDSKAAIHMVSAWSSANGVVLGQEKTAEKSNEITAIPALLEVLELKGCIVTIDAMGCQTSIANIITKKKADYVLALKGNQGNLHSEVKTFFDIALRDGWDKFNHDYYDEHDAGHGRIEYRQCWVIKPNAKWFPSISKWPSLQSIAMVMTERDCGDKITREYRYFIASLENPPASRMMDIVRQHWGVENALHWTLDVTFREDESRIRKEASPENYAIMRHIALNLIKSDTSIKASVKRKRVMAALNDDVRAAIIEQLF